MKLTPELSAVRTLFSEAIQAFFRIDWVSERTRWLVSLALFIPIIALYVCHYTVAAHGGWIGTGFVQYDQASYMAEARKFFDDGFHLFYSNPYSSSTNLEYIYFQPHIFLLGLVQKISGMDPGRIYVGFGFVMGVACIRVAMALYETLAGLAGTAERLGLVCFIWGGGVLALAGIALSVAQHQAWRDTMKNMFVLDPGANGWWFLNLGRNLVYPVEAYYHTVALGAILMLVRRKFLAAAVLGFLLSISHPFTGLQFLLIMVAWAWLERFFIRSEVVPLWFLVATIVMSVGHLGYYMWFLNLFEEQRSLFGQFSLPALIHASSFIPADLIVGGLAFAALHRLSLARELFSQPANRLFLVWFVVSFALVHHDFAVQARQPAHFSRGYTWIPLFLLGIVPMLAAWRHLLSIRHPFVRIMILTAVMLFFLSDNILWFASRTVGRYMATAAEENNGAIPDCRYNGIMMDADDVAFDRWLNHRPEHSELLVSQDPILCYVAVTYTPFRAWCSHSYNTPYAQQRIEEINRFYDSGVIPSGWFGRKLFIILTNQAPIGGKEATDLLPEVYRNNKYHVALLDLSGHRN